MAATKMRKTPRKCETFCVYSNAVFSSYCMHLGNIFSPLLAILSTAVVDYLRDKFRSCVTEDFQHRSCMRIKQWHPTCNCIVHF